jgi:hypothetical protein
MATAVTLAAAIAISTKPTRPPNTAGPPHMVSPVAVRINPTPNSAPPAPDKVIPSNNLTRSCQLGHRPAVRAHSRA